VKKELKLFIWEKISTEFRGLKRFLDFSGKCKTI